MRSHPELHAEIAIRNEVCDAKSKNAYFRIDEKFDASSRCKTHIYLTFVLMRGIVKIINAYFQPGLSERSHLIRDRHIVPGADDHWDTRIGAAAPVEVFFEIVERKIKPCLEIFVDLPQHVPGAEVNAEAAAIVVGPGRWTNRSIDFI